MATIDPFDPSTGSPRPGSRRLASGRLAAVLAVLTVLMVLTGSPSPAAAAPAPPTPTAPPAGSPGQPVGPDGLPIPVVAATISPELAGVRVDSAPHREAQARFDDVRIRLDDATQRLATAGDALYELNAQEIAATIELAGRIVERKHAIMARSGARTALRTVAQASYIQGQAVSVDLDREDQEAVLDDLTEVALLGVIQRQVVTDAEAAQTAVAAAEAGLDDATSRRDAARAETARVAAERDQAALDQASFTTDLVGRQVDVDVARVTSDVQGADFSLVVLDAYWRAARATAFLEPRCGITWWALAGINKVESGHGTYGDATVLADGRESKPIIGIALDGSNNTALIGDSDGGLLDGDTVFDRAVGPMQFIPSTWRRWARDGNGDGVADPQNLYDIALSAAAYLCAGGPMVTDDDLRRGYYSYNHSDAYVANVLGYAKTYSVFPIPGASTGGPA
jgi:membrane-bound lytic murein transglycosylase B